MQTTHEAHRNLDDAVRALRRPSSWPREREQVAPWARRLLSDDSLLAVDMENRTGERVRRADWRRPSPRPLPT
ncbi:hypothetical protein [Streptomyces sp. 3213.3]|uniref:hypothetical protein n=1 Tax=Streptomyces sp. 3213.3 TaxID=1855348 RepID=UPI003FA70004